MDRANRTRVNYMLFLFVTLIVCSCNSQNKATTKWESMPADSLVQKYENEFFSIMCPQKWTADWEEYVPESEDIARVLDSLEIKGGTVELWSPDQRLGVRLVKSVSAWLNPYGDSKQWCELSIMGRESEEGENEYLGSSEITDSIIIEGYPAAEVSFAYYNGTDTLMQRQYAIVPKPYQLYYANIKYVRGDEEAYYIGWKMLHTLHLKVK